MIFEGMKKNEFFNFLSRKVAAFKYPEGKEVHITCGTDVLSKGADTQMQPCDHEKSDIRLVVRIVDAVRKGHGSCLIHIVGTDVIILVGKFSYLKSLNPNR